MTGDQKGGKKKKGDWFEPHLLSPGLGSSAHFVESFQEADKSTDELLQFLLALELVNITPVVKV